jgi:hypothetical protein
LTLIASLVGVSGEQTGLSEQEWGRLKLSLIKSLASVGQDWSAQGDHVCSRGPYNTTCLKGKEMYFPNLKYEL